MAPVDFEKHPAIEAIGAWGSDLKRRIEEACFADYRDQVASGGPEALPKIRRAKEVWKQRLRADPHQGR